MRNGLKIVSLGGAALAVGAFALTPAISASGAGKIARRPVVASVSSLGFFTPASGDPKLAAILAKAQIKSSGFRFTPVTGSGATRAVTVAVRTHGNSFVALQPRAPLSLSTSAPSGVVIQPVAYKLGTSVGWKRFALPASTAQSEPGALQGGHKSTDVGYSNSKFSTRVQLESRAPSSSLVAETKGERERAVEVAGSYRLTRKIDLTAGVRYKAERDRLEAPTDTRRDSQAVYVGTSFRF